VGREKELSQIDAFLDAADVAFTALGFEGEAGIGKTTVWREARRRAEERGALVLPCRPSAAEAKLSFAALADVLAPVDEANLSALSPPQRDALEVALLRADPRADPPSPRAVAAGLLTLVRQLSRERTVIIAVDDAQWLDPPSRAALEFTARRLEGEHVGLLYSLRVPTERPPLGRAVAEDRLQRQVLGALSLAALGRIVAERLGRLPPRPLLARISLASGGNPFFALEIARLLIERGDEPAPGGGLPVPDELQALLVARVRRLPDAAREAVLLAAVLSSPDTQMVSPDTLAAAEEAEVLTVDARGRIEFVHPLFASAAYGSVPTARRRELHRRAAELVSDPEQQARHLALGSETPTPEVARRLDQAAELAARRGAPDAAAELAELAADQTPVKDANGRAIRAVRAAHFHFDAGDLARAQTLADTVSGGSLAAVVRAEALQLAARLAARRSDFTEAATFARSALELAGDDDRLRAGIELDLVYCAVSLGDFPQADVHARAAVEHAEASEQDGIVADALAVLTMSEFLRGERLDEARLKRALALEDPAMTRSFIMRPAVIHGMLRLWRGELDDAVTALTAVRDDAAERGIEGAIPMMSFYLVWTALWRGEIARAAEWADEARAAANLLEDPTTSGITLAASALVHAHDGHPELARRDAGEALALFERLQWRSGVIWPLWALGLAELGEGNPTGVDRVLGPLGAQLAAMGGGDPILTMFLPDEIEALVALGELERAEAHLGAFERSAQERDRAWALAAAARCRGALAAANGQRDDALTAFELALATHERTGMPFERARTLLLLGQAHRRFKQRGRAGAVLREAVAEFERLGSPSWARRARQELARIGGPGPSGDGLTETERRLAELAAAGLTNRQVADRAFVSVKTVEANLTRAYRKLGVRSRATLADALRAQDR
jgi:DNA-binding CsgD family transcriptional regulator/tetratricopeptide (TPR) repeat protein